MNNEDKNIKIRKGTRYCSKSAAVEGTVHMPYATLSVQASSNTHRRADKILTIIKIIKLKYSLYSQCQATKTQGYLMK